MEGNPFKVKLEQQSNKSIRVVFDVSPDVSESRNVMYKTFDPVHMPGAIYMYQGTSSRVFTLSNVKLVSRNQEEATTNIETLQRIKTWTLPYFGESGSPSHNSSADPRAPTGDISGFGGNNSFGGGSQGRFDSGFSENVGRSRGPRGIKDTRFNRTTTRTGLTGGALGAPPDVLLLSAYSAPVSSGIVKSGAIQNIFKVPVVMTTLNFSYPTEVDYIPTLYNVPMPTLMTLEITLNETHSPTEYERFSLEKFHDGILEGF